MAAPPFNLICKLPTGQTFKTIVPGNATLVDAYNAIAIDIEKVLGRPMPTDNFRLVLSGAGINLEIKDRLLSEYKHYFTQNNVSLHVVLRQPRGISPVNNPMNSAINRLNRASKANLNRVSIVARNAALTAKGQRPPVGGVSRKRKNKNNRKTRRN